MRKKLDIHWSEESIRQTDEIIGYLETRWTGKEILDFLEALKRFENEVCQFPELFPETGIKKSIRKAVVIKHISAYYSIQKDTIEVHTLFDTRQDPKKLKERLK